MIVHGDKYDYSEVINNTARDKVLILCKKHGRFLQKAASHLKGIDFPKYGCGFSKKTNWMVKQIEHAINGIEFTIPNTKYKADGYIWKNNKNRKTYKRFGL